MGGNRKWVESDDLGVIKCWMNNRLFGEFGGVNFRKIYVEYVFENIRW